jgi:hypothetical protein
MLPHVEAGCEKSLFVANTPPSVAQQFAEKLIWSKKNDHEG